MGEITGVDCFALRGRRDPAAYGFLVKVTVDNRITGWGEADTLPAAAAAVVEAPYFHDNMSGLAACLLGQDSSDVPALWKRMVTATLAFGRDGVARHAAAALDIALWDALGRERGVPVWSLLGSRQRDRLDVYAAAPLAETAAESGETARKLRERGFRAQKFGWAPFGLDPDEDEAIAAALRKGIGEDGLLLLDAGMAWNLEEALGRVQRLAPYNPFWLEEPFRPYDLQNYRALREAAPFAIAAGEMAATETELVGLAETGAVSVLQIDLARTGITQAVQIAAAANRAGVPVVNHSYSHLLNTAASLQLMAVAEKVSLFETQISAHEIRDALAAGQLRAENGSIAVPNGAGLGVEIDESVLRRFM